MSKKKEVWWNEIYNDDMERVPASVSDKILQAVNKLVKKGNINSAADISDQIKDLILEKKTKYEKSKKSSRENHKLLKTAKVIVENVLIPSGENINNNDDTKENNDLSNLDTIPLSALSAKLSNIKDIEIDLDAKIKAANERKDILFNQLEEERRGLSIIQNQLNETMATRRVIEAKILKEESSIKNLNNEYIHLIRQRETEILAAAKHNIKSRFVDTNQINKITDHIRQQYEGEVMTLRQNLNEIRMELKAKNIELDETRRALSNKTNEGNSKDAIIDIVSNANNIIDRFSQQLPSSSLQETHESSNSIHRPIPEMLTYSSESQNKNSFNQQDIKNNLFLNETYNKNKNSIDNKKNKMKLSSADSIINKFKKDASMLKHKLIKKIDNEIINKNHQYNDEFIIEISDILIKLWSNLFFINVTKAIFEGRPREIYSAADVETLIFDSSTSTQCGIISLFNSFKIGKDNQTLILKFIEENINFTDILKEIENLYLLYQSMK